MIRNVRTYVLLDPEECVPPHGLDMTPGGRDYLKVERLAEVFATEGFDPNEPALVGYPKDGMIQLLSGTHRHRAALWAGIRLPVVIWLRSAVEAAWGGERWPEIIADIPVKDLEQFAVEEGGTPIALADRVDLLSDMERLYE